MSDESRVIRFLIYAQASFFVCLSAAVVINDAGFSQNRGLSFYGEHWDTAVPFGLGFLLCDYFLLRAGRILTRFSHTRIFDSLLRILAMLLLMILLTPDNLNNVYAWMHIFASTLLFLFELGFAIWLTLRVYHDLFTWFLLAGQLIAGAVAMFSELQATRYLSEGSLFYQVFFGILLVWTIGKLIEQVQNRSNKKTSIGKLV